MYNIMSNFMSNYFGPFNKNACVYFLFISAFFFIALVLSFIGEIIFAVQNFNKLNFRVVTSGILILFNIFLAYFVNRLLYGMCIKSLD
jgi:hypothetical protein